MGGLRGSRGSSTRNMFRTFFAIAALFAISLANKDWELYKSQFGKSYDAETEQLRIACFLKNDALIHTQNSYGYERYGWTEYTDLCPQEFKAYHNLHFETGNTHGREYWRSSGTTSPAASVDWREKGAVTPIKNQGQCGSCWAFSTTGVLEGVHQIKTGELLSFSEQEIVSCDKGELACNGGDMRQAVEWVVLNGGINSELNYPYVSGTGNAPACNEAKRLKHVARFTLMVPVLPSEIEMASYMEKHGPLSIGVDASSWQNYVGGIMRLGCSGRQVDHGVLAVGYGIEGATEYWIVKNSWGTSWGEKGYIRLERGVNCCDIKSEATSAVAVGHNATAF